MKIVYLIDIVCPWCFIGKKYFDEIDDKFKKKITDIKWQPYFLNPYLNSKGIDRKDYLNTKFGSEKNANYIYQNIYSNGQKANIKFNFNAIKIMPNSLNVMYLITLIQDYRIASILIDQMFEAFFIKGENIGNNKVISKYAKKYFDSFDLTLLDNNKNKNYLLKLDKKLKLKGISGVPGIIVNDKYFISGALETKKLNSFFEKIILE